MESYCEQSLRPIEPKPVKPFLNPNHYTWVPCLPNTNTGTFVPVYNLMNLPNTHKRFSLIGGTKSKDLG